MMNEPNSWKILTGWIFWLILFSLILEIIDSRSSKKEPSIKQTLLEVARKKIECFKSICILEIRPKEFALEENKNTIKEVFIHY